MGFEGKNTSENMASSINTNPVVVRRILGTLRKAGFVSSQPGVGGGVTLTVDPASITLLDVYTLFDSQDLFPMHTNQPHPQCPSGSTIQAVLRPVYHEASVAMESILKQTTIAELAEQSWEMCQSHSNA